MAISDNENDDNVPQAAAPVVGRVAVKLPDFWVAKPRIWFLQADACFRTSNITADRTKYDHVLAKLPMEVLESVADVVEEVAEDAAAEDCYQRLRERLTGSYGDTEWQQLEKLVTLPGLGDMRPSALMNQMLSLLPVGEKPGKLFLHLFLRHLPAEVRGRLTDVKFDSPRAMAEQADRIWASNGGNSLVHAVNPVNPRRESPRRRSPSRPRRGRSQTPAAAGLCFYHGRFGDNADKCRAPCSWSGNGVAADGN